MGSKWACPFHDPPFPFFMPPLATAHLPPPPHATPHSSTASAETMGNGTGDAPPAKPKPQAHAPGEGDPPTATKTPSSSPSKQATSLPQQEQQQQEQGPQHTQEEREKQPPRGAGLEEARGGHAEVASGQDLDPETSSTTTHPATTTAGRRRSPSVASATSEDMGRSSQESVGGGAKLQGTACILGLLDPSHLFTPRPPPSLSSRLYSKGARLLYPLYPPPSPHNVLLLLLTPSSPLVQHLIQAALFVLYPTYPPTHSPHPHSTALLLLPTHPVYPTHPIWPLLCNRLASPLLSPPNPRLPPHPPPNPIQPTHPPQNDRTADGRVDEAPRRPLSDLPAHPPFTKPHSTDLLLFSHQRPQPTHPTQLTLPSPPTKTGRLTGELMKPPDAHRESLFAPQWASDSAGPPAKKPPSYLPSSAGGEGDKERWWMKKGGGGGGEEEDDESLTARLRRHKQEEKERKKREEVEQGGGGVKESKTSHHEGKANEQEEEAAAATPHAKQHQSSSSSSSSSSSRPRAYTVSVVPCTTVSSSLTFTQRPDPGCVSGLLACTGSAPTSSSSSSSSSSSPSSSIQTYRITLSSSSSSTPSHTTVKRFSELLLYHHLWAERGLVPPSVAAKFPSKGPVALTGGAKARARKLQRYFEGLLGGRNGQVLTSPLFWSLFGGGKGGGGSG